MSEWPPLPDECPVSSYKVEVRRCSTYFTVDASLLHRMPDGAIKESWSPFDDGSVYVAEPCWLFRLLGDTTERRIERAKVKVARRAERELARRRRLEAVAARVGANV